MATSNRDRVNKDLDNEQHMAESKAMQGSSYDTQHYLNTVIDCIVDNNGSPKAIQAPSLRSLRRGKINDESVKTERDKPLDIPELYVKAGEMVAQFDSSINRCKTYNEAKVNRKYEIMVKDLEGEIRKLSQKLKLEQEARSPTKKHISEILDKLVSYKDEN